MDHALHRARAKLAWPYLVSLAEAKAPPFTYTELGHKIGAYRRVVQYPLGKIQDYCEKNKLPRLQALVVQEDGRLPGPGYHGSRTRRGHADELARVYAHEWPSKPPALD